MRSAKCEITVEIDREDRTFTAGEAITGTVRVRAEKECEIRRAPLHLEWRIHGKGNPKRRGREEIELEEGPFTLRPGEERAYPFEFIAPESPYTYHGHYVNVDWYVRGRLEIGWARDPEAEADVLLAPSVQPPAEPAGADEARAMPVAELPEAARRTLDAMEGVESRRQGCTAVPAPVKTFAFGCSAMLLFGFPLLIAMLALLDALVSGNITAETIGAPLLGFVIFGGAGTITYLKVIRNRMLRKRLGAVEFKLMTATAAPGGAIPWLLRFAPEKELTVNTVRVRLHGYERTVRGAGTNRTTYTHTVVDREVSLDRSRRIEADEDTVISGRIHVPPGAPFAFDTDFGPLLWEMEATVDIATWPDWKESIDVKVVAPEPAVAAGG